VVLVAVMAVCLIAMSGLYVLDWHNRNYAYHRTHYIDNKPETPGHMIFRGGEFMTIIPETKSYFRPSPITAFPRRAAITSNLWAVLPSILLLGASKIC